MITHTPPDDLAKFPLDPDLIVVRIDRLNAETDFFRRLLIAAIHLRAIQVRSAVPARQGGEKAVTDAAR